MLIHEATVELPDARRRILAFADLQFDQNFSLRKLQKLLDHCRYLTKQENIDYIFILGDIINSLNVINLPSVYTQFLGVLRQLAKCAPIIMVLGNHDTYFYDRQNHLQIAPPKIYQKYLQDLQQIPQLHLLDTAAKSSPIFDDGAIRVLGLDLPAPCYLVNNAQRAFGLDGQAAFEAILRQWLPELMRIKNRDYYLLVHSPAYLRPGLIPQEVMVLSGHVHYGLVPPILDELTKFSHRGIIGPGLTRTSKHTTKYELFPSNARLRPTAKQPWLTLRPITYLADRLLRPLNVFYPSLSFTLIRENPHKPSLQLTERYLIRRRSD